MRGGGAESPFLLSSKGHGKIVLGKIMSSFCVFVSRGKAVLCLSVCVSLRVSFLCVCVCFFVFHGVFE